MLDAHPRRSPHVLSEDVEYFTSRCAKQVELAGKAKLAAVREAHTSLAELLGGKARAAMAAAMRTNARGSDVRAASLLRLDMELDLNRLLGSENADRFRSLRVE